MTPRRSGKGSTDNRDPSVAHLLESRGRGTVWGTASADLNATLLVRPPGHVVATHVNDERDVLLLVIEGSATVLIGAHEPLSAPGTPP